MGESRGLAGRTTWRDSVTTVLLVVLAAFICQQASLIEIGSLNDPGPGLFPFGAGIAIAALSILRWIRPLLVAAPEPAPLAEQAESRVESWRLWVIATALLGYVLLASWAGFAVATFLFAMVFLRVAANLKPWALVATAFLVAAGNQLLFVRWLDVGLPNGIFW